MLDKVEAVRYFCMAAETLHFRETANRLAISPQVVTRMIAELERELGEPLFKRNTDVILTELLTALSPHPDLHIDWRPDTALYNSITKQIDIGIRISLEIEPHFIAKKITHIKERIVASPTLLNRLGKPRDLDEL